MRRRRLRRPPGRTTASRPHLLASHQLLLLHPVVEEVQGKAYEQRNMAESLLLPVVSGVVGKAADEVVKNITRMWGVDADRDKLERQLLAVQRLLVDAEVKSETNPAVRRWMKVLKAVAYQADDVLDLFHYEALRREAQAGVRVPTAHKVLRYITLQSPLLFRLKVSRNMNGVLKKINELVMEMHTFGLVEHVEAPQPPLYRQTYSALDESAEIFGRDDDKEVLVKLLLEQQDQKSVQVLPIIGMGGLGKTTLAKMVYNDARVQRHFELKMWYCVSENFEATAVVRCVIELATDGRCDLPDNIELLRRRMQEVIGRKRYLLILDDVWNEEQQKWEDDLKPLLCCSNDRLGSMIVVTSRSRRVASIMGTLPTHELGYLGEDDSWKLFSKKAFSKGVQELPELVRIGKQIVNKCKGLPLALKTMGGLMGSRLKVQEWDAILNSNMGDGKDEVLSVLKLSYNHLLPEMKQCFAFCAVFPKDYEMNKDMLIQLWMANGFIHEDQTLDLLEKADFVFNELVWRSFLQDVRENRFLFPSSHMEIGCKMHDLMHDLAKDVTDECAFAQELSQNKASIEGVRHMQLVGYELEETNELLKGTSFFRTLLIQSENKDIKDLKSMPLRALSYLPSSVIHKQLIDTAHLRYLDLSWSKLVILPSSICMLYHLQSLRLENCYMLQYLPERMTTSLRKLCHLYLLGCNDLKRMPPKLSLLHNLRTLTKFIVDTGDGFGIEELKDLRYLSNRLELFNLRKVKSGSKANLHEKQNLSELLLYWGKKQYDNPTNVDARNDEQVLESLAPHPQSELKLLEVHGYGGLSIPQWMKDPRLFLCLRELAISHCPGCIDLRIVWSSSCLERLSLSYMDSLTTLCGNIDMEAAGYNTPVQMFRKLKSLELIQLPELESWVENGAGEPSSLVVFPVLKNLSIFGCRKFSGLPESLHSESFPSLVSLNIGPLADVAMPLEGQQNKGQSPLYTLRCLELYGDDVFVSVFNTSKLHLGLGGCLVFVEKLIIRSCCNIVCWPVEELQCFPRLRVLVIEECTNLEGKSPCPSSEEILPLPQLERLSITSCRSLLGIPLLPASLEKLEIRLCDSLVALPSDLGNLTRLRYLEVRCCSGVKSLPGGLASLEILMVYQCPAIEKFPQDLVQRLPALISLGIDGCPDLQRRCRRGGEYFDLVSSIPDKHIPFPAAASNLKKILKLKRLLPSC